MVVSLYGIYPKYFQIVYHHKIPISVIFILKFAIILISIDRAIQELQDDIFKFFMGPIYTDIIYDLSGAIF